MKIRTWQENYNAIMKQGEPFVVLPNDPYEEKSILMATNIKEFVAAYSAVEMESRLIMKAISDPKQTIAMLMAIQGVSKTGLEAIICKFDRGDFGDDVGAACELAGFHKWAGDKKDFTSGVLGKDKNSAKISGLVSLMISGHKLPERVLQEYPFFRNCSKESFLTCGDVPETHLLQKVRNYYGGSRRASRGKRIQEFYSMVLLRLGVPNSEKKLFRGSRTWDIVISEPLLGTEISSSGATGSHIGDKSAKMISDVEQGDFISVFVAIGPSWALRSKDCKAVAKALDMCFGPTREEALAFMEFVTEKAGVKVTKNEIYKTMNEVLNEV